MKILPLISLLGFVTASQVARATVIAGSFDWIRSSSAISGTASFTYDTDTNIGNIEGFHPGSGAWVSPGYWSFSLQVAGVNLYSNKVLVSSFSDLTDFSNREILIMPPTSLENPTTPYAITGEVQWRLRQGQAYGIVDEDWFTSDQALPSPSFGTGTTSNFVAVPEPQAYMCLLLGGSLLAISRNRRKPYKKKPNKAEMATPRKPSDHFGS